MNCLLIYPRVDLFIAVIKSFNWKTTNYNNNNNICLKSNIQTSSVDCAPRELTHACSRSGTCSRSDTEACDMCYVFNVNFDGFF